MGCGSSTDTVVQTLTPEEVNGDGDDRGSKLCGSGDSAMSKGTTDSGVVMEKETPMLPGAVPRKLPPLTSEWIRESELDKITQATRPGFLQQESTAQERQKSSEILEELLNQGIIPVEQTKERSSGAGEAYSIMLNDRDVVRRRPPARLESLKARKAQPLPSREDIEEKIRMAEERRKLKEDELKMRLRAKSARVHVRAPVLRTEEDEDTRHIEPLESSVNPKLLHPPVAEVEECVGEAGGDNREFRGDEREAKQKVGVRGDNRGEGAERISEDGDEAEEVRELLTALGELESDSSFQHAAEKDETF